MASVYNERSDWLSDYTEVIHGLCKLGRACAQNVKQAPWQLRRLRKFDRIKTMKAD